MTVLHLMNCPHSEDGWCLECVIKLVDENCKLKDDIDWLEKGITEWEEACVKHSHEAMRYRAQAKIALAHLDKVLNGCHNADEQMQAHSAARLWLESIGYEQK